MFGIRINIVLSVMLHVLMFAAVFVTGSSSELKRRPVVAVSLIDSLNAAPGIGQKESSGQELQKRDMPAKEVTAWKTATEDQPRSIPPAPEEAVPARDTPGLPSLPTGSSSVSSSVSSPVGEGSTAGSSAAYAGQGTVFPSAGRAAGTSAVTSGGGAGQLHGSGGDASLRQRIRAALQANLVYPYIARKRQMEGSVMVSFRINQTGNPESIRILKGSGYSILDSAARDTVVKASPFPAANNVVEVPITFTLKNP